MELLKKHLWAQKEQSLRAVAMVDFIIAELDKASKLDADTKSTLEGFKFSSMAAAPVQQLRCSSSSCSGSY